MTNSTRTTARICLLLAALSWARVAAAAPQAPAAQQPAAQTAPPADPVQAPAPAAGTEPASTQTTPPADSGGDLNFDLLDSTPKTPEQQAQKVQQDNERLQNSLRIERLSLHRRRMLNTHQILGFVALASLTATVVLGHLNYDDLYVSGNYTARYRTTHLGLGIATSVLFGGTGLLGVFAPNPYPKKIRLDTALIHKITMILATAGMVTQVILGPISVARTGRLDQPALALSHVVVGYATWAFMATGVIALVF